MDNLPAYYLYPANLFVPPETYLINTLLGSCVAICLYDPISKIGGMNHYMLPLWNGEGLASPKYGNIAIEKLLEGMLNKGARRQYIIAKIFGGGEVIESQHHYFNIGKRNIELAHSLLAELKIPIKAESTGGKLGRKIQFNTETGSVKMKYINRQIVGD
ncbi:MAG: chemotaxis protein CheD [Salinivirgaceae bacterium]|jgi:chemotaxis protein CheD